MLILALTITERQSVFFDGALFGFIIGACFMAIVWLCSIRRK